MNNNDVSGNFQFMPTSFNDLAARCLPDLTPTDASIKSWSYTINYQYGSRETVEAPTEQEARNVIFARHGSRRIYPVAGRWGIAIEGVN